MSDISPPSSTKSTTPPTDNRGNFVEDVVESHPDFAQPYLDSVNPAQDREGQSPRARQMRKDAMSKSGLANESPRSIDMKAAVEDATKNVQARSSRSSRRHRRVQSEDPTLEGSIPNQPLGAGYHPAMPYPHPYMMPTKSQSFERGEAPPPRHSHSRTHSMPQAPNLMSTSMMGYSPVSPVPMINPETGETGPLLPFARSSPSGSYRKRKSQAGSRTHGPVLMPGKPGMYGSFEEGAQDMVPPPPQSAPPSSLYRRDGFSPRGELMSLTGAVSSSRGRHTPPSSPSQRNADMTGTPAYSRTPRRSPLSSSLRSPGSGQLRPDDVRVSFSPGTPLQEPYTAQNSSRYLLATHGSSDLNDSVDLSDPYIKRGKKHHHSLRRMHMRQQSAQLYMEGAKGVEQPVACRDVLFSLLFVIHLIGIMYLGTTYSRDAIMVNATGDEWTVNIWYRNVIYVSALCGVFAVALSTLTLIIMTVIVQRLVQVSLILTIVLSFAWGTIGIGVSPKNVVPITGIIALAFSVGYAFVVWDRIPFAAANLMAGLTGVRRNAGTILVAFVFQFLALVWSIYYTFVGIGVYDALNNGDLNLSQRQTVFVYSMLFISYYWTYTVLVHIVQVTVAGTIGSWWFKPDAESSFCSSAVTKSFVHAMFYSFGSICFGSLLVEPVRLIRQLAVFARPSQEDSALMCLHECFACVQQCITACVDNLASTFNVWAFTYIGLYHYSLLEAGHNATVLFQRRGWTTIVSDDLIHNVLLMVSLVIGGVTGCFGILIQSLDALNFSTLGEPTFTAFGIGLFMGLVVTSVLFGIISSSVNAVIVLFAGSPVDFETNHPELNHELRSAWREVWPGCMEAFDIVDTRVAANKVMSSARDVPTV